MVTITEYYEDSDIVLHTNFKLTFTYGGISFTVSDIGVDSSVCGNSVNDVRHTGHFARLQGFDYTGALSSWVPILEAILKFITEDTEHIQEPPWWLINKFVINILSSI